MTLELVVVGGGRMGGALVAGLLAHSWAPAERIAVVERDPARREALAVRHPGLVLSDDVPGGVAALVAVKPPDVAGVCRTLAARAAPRVLSVAAGIRLASLEAWLTPAEGSVPGVLRGMPNTPALVGRAASALSAGESADAADLEWATGILSSVGTVVSVPEPLLDAVTGLSGSGPAYLFLVAEALVDAGVLVGLPRDLSSRLTVQTLLGAAALLAETGEPPEALRAAVTSPAGTTAAGLRVLEAAAVRAAILDAVTASARRAGELGAAS